MYEPPTTEILFASNKFIIEKFENIITDKITINRLKIKIYEVNLVILVISKRYFDLDKSSLFSVSANFCRYNCPKIDPIVNKMKIEIPRGDIISSWINSGLVQIATSMIKQRFIIRTKRYNILISEKRILEKLFNNTKPVYLLFLDIVPLCWSSSSEISVVFPVVFSMVFPVVFSMVFPVVF
jgi:hypothetical protein